ncbi:molybdopterin oxidoreductase family protein [Rhabdothermincola salaria]|uniref:molybdopterin oxidoreductase family protein n=1 Tax=Rhabdothermincola salaria TaxID=2903142 RepID=UPI001E4AD615|nr:molybdopterin oxidoreductase family protein [Rhabdothermincola salaria]MCD9622336.1 molybdopterin oxidoreductase family protein [Rhabdothermincola salaria]
MTIDATTDGGAEAGDATASTSVHHRTCPLCEATCGLELTVREGQVVRIRGDRANTFSNGFICPKGSALQRLHTDPDRLRHPVVRHGDDPATATWQEVSWEEAFRVVAEGLQGVMERHGRDAVAVYLGNPSIHSLGATVYNRPLVKALGTTNVYSASTVDQMPKHVSSGYLFGDPLLIAVPDLDRTDHLLILGANPYESNGSLCTAPDFPGRLEAIRERGGKVVVVDPRRTATAEHADEWVPIRPGTDAHLLVAMVQVLFAEDRVDLGRLGEHVVGVDELRAAIERFTPEVVAPRTGVSVDTIRRMAREVAESPTAAVYGRVGTHTVRFGTIAAWAVDVLNVVTGNLDRAGGAMFSLPAHTAERTAGPGRGFAVGRRHSRVRGHPEVRGELPVATLAEEILTPGEGQVRAMVTVAGNPVLSTPDAARLDAALGELEFMVSVDPYRNETTRHAHVILPPPSALERSEYHLAFYAMAVRNYAEWSPPLFATEAPQEHEILARLALIATGPEAGDDPGVIDDLLITGALQAAIDRPGSPVADRTVEELRRTVAAPEGRSAVDQVVDVMIRTGDRGDWFGEVPDGLSLDVLEANPHGVDLGALTSRLPAALRTPSGRVELAPEPVLADLQRLAADLEAGAGRADDGSLLLVGRRHLRSNNSWMHNVEVLVKGRFRCTLQVHPDDADRLGLADGGTATVSSRVGRLTAAVEVTDALLPGVVSLPHGWGHDLPGTSAEVAGRRPGVNSNLLTDGEQLDPLSGNAVLNAIPVSVAPA